eukprot:TRINITY_DN28203_c0_g1_i2.p1 TRINITY_DN28203_c0_g1~~TRINITY_DN28203_c0_g1_i2.p1  ORF type:complete len:178 (-),score=17.67 TRINITY_DN28203_c0_g1_i2:107-601(-)
MDAGDKARMEQQQIARTYEYLQAEYQAIAERIGELDSDRHSHSLVVTAIKDMDPKRRCFRMVGDVLVERTVEEVLPAVKENMKGIEELIERFTDQLTEKEKQIADFQSKFGIRKAGKSEETTATVKKEEDKSGDGVLVFEKTGGFIYFSFFKLGLHRRIYLLPS